MPAEHPCHVRSHARTAVAKHDRTIKTAARKSDTDTRWHKWLPSLLSTHTLAATHTRISTRAHVDRSKECPQVPTDAQGHWRTREDKCFKHHVSRLQCVFFVLVARGFEESHPTKPVGAQVQTHAVEHHGQILSSPHRGGGSVCWASAWRTEGMAQREATSATIYNINPK